MWTSHKVKSWCLCVHVCLVHCACPLRFATNEQGLLLASDVAARGLDIHKVQHVIHYHVPVNSDVRGREGGREGGGGGGGGEGVVARSDTFVVLGRDMGQSRAG